MSSILFCGMYLRRLDSVAAVAPLDMVVDIDTDYYEISIDMAI